MVLHRNDRGHDERGIFPADDGVGGAAVRFAAEDPDECQRQAAQGGLAVLWPAQDAAGGASSCSPILMTARSSWPG